MVYGWQRQNFKGPTRALGDRQLLVREKEPAQVERVLFERPTCSESTDQLLSGKVADSLLDRPGLGAGSLVMRKVLRWIERIAHTLGLMLAIVAIVWIGVIIGRPSEKSGNQPNFAV